MPLLLREEEVQALLSVGDAIEALERTFRAQAEGRAVNLPRQRVRWPGGTLHVMAAGDLGSGYVGLKAYTAVGGQTRFVVLLFHAESGELLAIIEADRLGRLRTGAATGLATRYLARPDARVVGMIGAGRQAATQLMAVCAVRPIAEARVYSPTPERRAAFAHRMRETLGIPVQAVERPEAAVEGADILITITSAREPVLRGAWLRPGVHLNAAGSNALLRRELDEEAIARADLIVIDSRAQGQIEAGDFLEPLERGRLQWERVYELRDVVAGRVGRAHPEQITLFKSLGIALEDVAVAAVAYERARAQGAGERIRFLEDLLPD
ncbi:MAG: ornithine cyclodeaminase family protein [Thermoflexus hugenholtzii]|jgi:alanine dehydrogenase|uniref:ornithine cyclodeaminase family protein n=1 Tax=Thermoflexus TaxID=1495649 RepID=UPI001C7926D5|nr:MULTISPECIES: ornithine cyclodeaminase family protein [Thermoflexus]QWK11703.1 MAG: ornithine cyclodeaminase family protein [Thermoflexus hugenholtzii]